MSLTTTLRTTTPFAVNGVTYRPPARPVVVICIDGCADEYLSVSIVKGRMPHVARLAGQGYRGLVRSALPSFTNVNNAAIVTGTPPRVTGICGNYFLDPATGKEVMTNSSKFLRARTILASAAEAGRKVAFITAKDKLRELFSVGLIEHGGIAFSAEKSDQVTLAEHGINDTVKLVGQAPPIYSADASLYVLRAGAALVAAGRSDFLYLSLTDYMQHKFAPEAAASLDFYEGINREVGRLLELGAVVGITADHGMNAKNTPDGKPNVIYLESELNVQFGGGFRVICPITDPYVVHHGALGSAVTVYVPKGADLDAVARWTLDREGVTEVHTRETAARKLELIPDMIGDLYVLSGRDVALGKTPGDHDLSQLEGGLRSHGGRYEEMVPMVLSEPLTDAYAAKAAGDPRNFHIFDFTCNGVRA